MSDEETPYERREREERERSMPPKEVQVTHAHMAAPDPRSMEEVLAEAQYNRECRRAGLTLDLAGALLIASVKTNEKGTTNMMAPSDALDHANTLHQYCEALFEKPCADALAKLVAARGKRLAEKA